jgi:hypothetical protein
MDQNILTLAEAMKHMKVIKYGVTITLPGTPGETASDSVVINRSDFAWRKTMYAMVTDDPTDPYNFSIDVSLQNDKRFYKSPNPPMANIFGSPRHGIWYENAPVVIIPDQTTVFVTLANHYAASGDDKKIQVWLVGNEKDKQA